MSVEEKKEELSKMTQISEMLHKEIFDKEDEIRKAMVDDLIKSCPNYIDLFCKLERLKRKEAGMRKSLRTQGFGFTRHL